MVVAVQLCCVLIHHLVRILHRSFVRRRLLIILLLRRVTEQVLDCTTSCRSLIDSKCCGELPMSTDLNRVQYVHSEILTVVADEIVRRPRLSHVVNDHFTCDAALSISSLRTFNAAYQFVSKLRR